METHKHPFTRAQKSLLLTPLLCGLVMGGWWLSDQRSMAAPPTQNPKNLFAVPIDPRLSGDGRLIVVGIQLQNHIPITDAQGNRDYFNEPLGNEARFWNAQTLAPLPSLPLLATPSNLALSSDGALLALSGGGDEFRVVDLQTRKTLWMQSDAASAKLDAPEPGMTVVLAPHGLSNPAFSPDGRTLAAWDTFIDAESGRQQITGYIFEARTGARKASWQGAPGSRLNGRALHFSPDGRFLASNELQPLVHLGDVPYARPEIRDASTGKLLRTLPFNHAGVAAFGPDNRLLLLIPSPQYGTDVLEVNAVTGQRLWSYTGTIKDADGALSTIDSAFYSPDKQQIALGFRGSKSVVILSARDGKQRVRFQVSDAPGAP